MQAVNFVISLLLIVALALFHGYTNDTREAGIHIGLLWVFAAFYVAHIFLRNRHCARLSSMTLWRPVLTITAPLLVITLPAPFDIASPARWAEDAGVTSAQHASLFLSHLWLVGVAGFELGRASRLRTRWRLSAPWLFILSFVVLILVGSSLLMLPSMTSQGQPMAFADAMFTSVSANCVTGLTVLDVARDLSIHGKSVVLIMVQLGGLNIVLFATYFLSRYHRGRVPASDDLAVKELFHAESTSTESTRGMLLRAAVIALSVEMIGAVMLYGQLPHKPQDANTGPVFNALFHSVSAFNNAGFSVFDNGLRGPSFEQNLGAQSTIMVLIIFGGIGFATLWELSVLLTRPREQRALSVSSKVALGSAGALVMAGALLFAISEDGSPFGMGGALWAGSFQSVSSRTAGFDTIDISALHSPTLVLLMVLMFIGGSSGSTAGGVKTSTCVALLAGAADRLRARAPRFGVAVVGKSLAIVGLGLATVVLGTVVIVWAESMPTLPVAFEVVSAFGTVGLSTGITDELGGTGRGVLMTMMFVGRIGPLALVYALFHPTGDESEQSLMVG